MKTLFTVILIFCIAPLAFAQEGSIYIEQDPRIGELVNVYNSVNRKTEYYQIQVGFKNKEEEAKKLLEAVEIDFPGWHSEIIFQEPTYRVRLVKIRNKMEAERKLIQIRKKYSSAFIIQPESSVR